MGFSTKRPEIDNFERKKYTLAVRKILFKNKYYLCMFFHFRKEKTICIGISGR